MGVLGDDAGASRLDSGALLGSVAVVYDALHPRCFPVMLARAGSDPTLDEFRANAPDTQRAE